MDSKNKEFLGSVWNLRDHFYRIDFFQIYISIILTKTQGKQIIIEMF